MNVITMEFNFIDFAFVTLLQCIAKMFMWYLILQKKFVREIREINQHLTFNCTEFYSYQ